MSFARIVAYRVLRQIDAQEFSDSRELLHQFAKQHELNNADLRLASAIVFGCLRYRLGLDAAIAKHLDRPSAHVSPAVQTILRMVAFQHFYLDKVPAHAICNDAVALVGLDMTRNAGRQRGFVNAIARKIIAVESPLSFTGLSESYSFPTWLIGLFKMRFEADKIEEILKECNTEPPVVLRVNTLQMSRAEAKTILSENDVTVAEGRHAPQALVLERSSDLPKILHMDAFKQGAFYIQDEASQLVSVFADPKEGETVLDLCAAPGGKTTHLAELAGGQCSIIATDINENRMDMFRENIARMQTPCVTIVPYNELAQYKVTGFDLVLVDAPCSGLGTIRRNPEIKWRLTYDGLAQVCEVQYDILCSAAAYVKPQGRMVYSTCSVSMQENEKVVRRFLDAHEGWYLDENKTYCSWEHDLTMDGFCIHILRRK